MILNLRFLSGEKDDFILDMQIDSRATFAQLHKAIQQQLNYDSSQMASFFVTDSQWNKETEITLVDMVADANTPAITMDWAVIEDHIQDAHQRFLYVFDFFSERCLFVEVMNMNNGALTEPICTQCSGEIPEQIIMDQNFEQSEDFSDFDDLYDEMDDLEDFDPDNEFNPESFDDDYQY